jgi:CheY-like chemotaxis protein
VARRTVLVVDDEMHLRIFIGAVFETAGFTPVLARDGEDGLNKARSQRPDLISLDLMMPGEGGIKMFRELKADPGLKDVPVMIVSAVGGPTFEHALETLGAATRAAGITYSRFMEGLKAAQCALDRKVLADIAAQDAEAFTELVNLAKNALKAKPGAALAKA